MLVPADTPQNTPAPLMVPTAGVLLDQPPNGVASDCKMHWPTHTVLAPVMAAGIAFTLITPVRIQPVLSVYVIIDEPAERPVNKPVVALIVPVAGVPLLHVPPGVALDSSEVLPWQILIEPVMAAGMGCTVNTDVVKQVLGKVYVMIVVPGGGVADMPVTRPVPKPTVAIAGLLLVHVPLGTGWLSVVVNPSHTLNVPVIATGAGVTVTTIVDVQPALNAYVIVVVPGLIPVTMPVAEPIVPTDGVLLAQLPPGVLFVNVICEPTHTLVGPTIGAAAETTVITMVTAQPATR